MSATVCASAQPNVVAWNRTTGMLIDVPEDLTNVVTVTMGTSHAVALLQDATVRAWSWDSNFSLQTNTPAGLTNVAAIAAGATHSLALKNDGTVIAWGTPSWVPPNLSNVVAVAAADSRSLALRADGTVVAWDRSTIEKLPPALADVVGLAAPTAPVRAVVRGNGRILEWPTVQTKGTSVAAAASWDGNVVGLQPDGTVASFDNVGGSSLLFTNAQALSSAGGLAISREGLILSSNTHDLLNAVTNVVAVAGNGRVGMAVIGRGQPILTTPLLDRSARYGDDVPFFIQASGEQPMSYRWQFNGTDIPGATGPTLVVANMQQEHLGSYKVIVNNARGSRASRAAKLSFFPVFVGGTALDPISQKTDVVAIGPAVGLYRDGTVFDVNLEVPPGLSNVTAVTGNGAGSIAAFAGANAYWGAAKPPPPEATNLVRLSMGAGSFGNCAGIRPSGAGLFWSSSGYRAEIPHLLDAVADANYWYGLQWNGDLRRYSSSWGSPVLSNVVTMSAFQGHGLAIVDNGSVTGWGNNTSGQLDIPMDLTNAVAIAAGSEHSVALRPDGTLTSWGYTKAAAGVPAGLTNVVAIAAGAYSTFALVGAGAPYLSVPLVDRIGYAGGSATFLATATGERPLQYTWHFNGQDIPGATNSMLFLNQLSRKAEGEYSVIVSNRHGLVKSRFASLTVHDLGPALGSTNAVWTCTGEDLWTARSDQSRSDGTSAGVTLKVGSVGTLQATIVGPGTLRFWYKYASASGLTSVRLDSLRLKTLFYSSNWQEEKVYIGSGKHVMSLEFQASAGDRTFWIDDVTFIEGATRPVFSFVGPESVSQAPRARLYFEGWADGTLPLGWQWKFAGQEIPAATSQRLEITDFQPAKAGVYSVVLSNEAGITSSPDLVVSVGRIANWGLAPVPASLTNASALSAAGLHGLALQPDGSVREWGRYGELPVPPHATNLVAVAAGEEFSLGLQTGGTAIAWGNNSRGQTNVPPDLGPVLGISGGSGHALALLESGGVRAWGANDFGQCNIPPDLTNAVAVCAAQDYSLALRADGTLSAWGKTVTGTTAVLAGLGNVVMVRGGSGHCVALLADGTVAGWGATNGTTRVPSGITNAIGVAAGNSFTTVLLSDGRLAGTQQGPSWGSPQPVDPIADVSLVAGGGYVTLAQVGDGPPQIGVPLGHAQVRGPVFNVQAKTEPHRVYRLEYADALDQALWTAGPLVAGSGKAVTFTAPIGQSRARFYRLRHW